MEQAPVQVIHEYIVNKNIIITSIWLRIQQTAFQRSSEISKDNIQL